MFWELGYLNTQNDQWRFLTIGYIETKVESITKGHRLFCQLMANPESCPNLLIKVEERVEGSPHLKESQGHIICIQTNG